MRKPNKKLIFAGIVYFAISIPLHASTRGAIASACKALLTAGFRTWDDILDKTANVISDRETRALLQKLSGPDVVLLSSAKGKGFDIRIFSDEENITKEFADSLMGHIQSFVENVSSAGFPVRNIIDIYLINDPQKLNADSIGSANAFINLRPRENTKRSSQDSRDASKLILPLSKKDGQLDVDFQTLQHEIGHQILRDVLYKSKVSSIGMYEEAFADSISFLSSGDSEQRVDTGSGQEVVIRDLYQGTTLTGITQSELEVMKLGDLKRKTGPHDASVLISPLISAPVAELSGNVQVRSKTFLEYWKNMAVYRKSFENKAESIFGKNLDLNREKERLSVAANTLYAYAVYWITYKDHPRKLNFKTHLEKNCTRIGLSFEEVERLSQELKPSRDIRDLMIE